MTQEIQVNPVHINLSPLAFHRTAKDFYKCRQDFQSLYEFSLVPYFLLCRAIELGLKAKHLENKTQSEVKNAYWHRLHDAYSELKEEQQILTNEEVDVLRKASQIYSSKRFEYLQLIDPMTGYSKFPDIGILDKIAEKLLGEEEHIDSTTEV